MRKRLVGEGAPLSAADAIDFASVLRLRSGQVVQAACLALADGKITSSKKAVTTLVEGGVIEALRSCLDDPRSCIAAVWILAGNLVLTCPDDLLSRFANCGWAASAATNASSLLRQHVPVAVYPVIVLARLLRSHAPCRSSLFPQSALDALILSLSTPLHSEEEPSTERLEETIAALAALAKDSPRRAEAIRAAGVAEAVLHALKAAPDRALAQHFGLLLVEELVSDDGLTSATARRMAPRCIDAGAADVACRALRQHGAHGSARVSRDVALAASKLLGGLFLALGKRPEAAVASAVAAGAFPAAAAAARAHWRHSAGEPVTSSILLVLQMLLMGIGSHPDGLSDRELGEMVKASATRGLAAAESPGLLEVLAEMACGGATAPRGLADSAVQVLDAIVFAALGVVSPANHDAIADKTVQRLYSRFTAAGVRPAALPAPSGGGKKSGGSRDSACEWLLAVEKSISGFDAAWGKLVKSCEAAGLDPMDMAALSGNLPPGADPSRSADPLQAFFGLSRTGAAPSGAEAPAGGEAAKGAEAAARPGAESSIRAPCCDRCGALPKPGAPLKFCSVCRVARYCNTACQKSAWKTGHKEQCEAAVAEQRKSSGGGQASSRGGAKKGSSR